MSETKNRRLGENTIRNINGLAKASATAEVGHVALDAIGTVEPTPIADTANAIWYVFEGDYKNAAFSGISVVPYVGDEVGKGLKYGGKIITQIQKHHIIPQQLFKEIPAIGDFILKNSGINLKKLPNRFHGNHPAYTNWIKSQFNELVETGNFTKEGLQGLIKNANSEINKAYKEFRESGQSMNDYFKNKK
nr:AHH domain-containing protein [Pseudomonas sp.]